MSQTRVHTPRTAPVHLIFPLQIENCSLHLTILPVHVQKWMSCRCMSSFLLLLLMLCSWRRTDSACTPTHTCTVIQLCNNNIVRAYLQDKYRPALMSRHKLIYKHVPKENSAVWDIFQEINKRPLYICIYKIFMCDKKPASKSEFVFSFLSLTSSFKFTHKLVARCVDVKECFTLNITRDAAVPWIVVVYLRLSESVV